MSNSKDTEQIVGRIHELKRRKQAANDELVELKREMQAMVCIDEGQEKPPSIFVTYDRQGAWEFAATCAIMRKATSHLQSRRRMLVHRPRHHSK